MNQVWFVLATVTGAPEPWTVAQVLAGAPLQNAVAEGRAHNPGVITNLALHPYYPAIIGKRSAEPYTLAQVAAGAPVRNAAADGRLHNIGVVRTVTCKMWSIIQLSDLILVVLR